MVQPGSTDYTYYNTIQYEAPIQYQQQQAASQPTYAQQQAYLGNAIQDLRQHRGDDGYFRQKYHISEAERTRLTSILESQTDSRVTQVQGGQSDQTYLDSGKIAPKINIDIKKDIESIEGLKTPAERTAELQTRADLALRAYSELRRSGGRDIKDVNISVRRSPSHNASAFPPPRYDIEVSVAYASGRSVKMPLSLVDPESKTKIRDEISRAMDRSSEVQEADSRSQQLSRLELPSTDPAISDRMSTLSSLHREMSARGINAEIRSNANGELNIRFRSVQEVPEGSSGESSVPNVVDRQYTIASDAVSPENAGDLVGALQSAGKSADMSSTQPLQSSSIRVSKNQDGSLRFDVQLSTRAGDDISFSININDLKDIAAINDAVAAGVKKGEDKLAGRALREDASVPIYFSKSGSSETSGEVPVPYGQQPSYGAGISDHRFLLQMGLFSASSNPYQELTKAIYEQIEEEKRLLEEYLEARKKEKEERLAQQQETTNEINMAKRSAEEKFQEMVVVVRSYEQMQRVNNMIIDLEREERLA